MYLKIVLLKAKAIGALSRLIGKGSGIVIAGRLIMALAPNAVEKLAKGKRIVLISGTNGKSTTSKLIAAALGSKYSIAHNHTGANLFSGIAAALGANPKAEVAVLEVDELVLPWAIEKTKPELIVLLNLGRDQLDRLSEDRLSEVRIVSNKWRAALAGQRVLASTDDPFVVYAAKPAKTVTWFSAGERGHIDATTCPECGALFNWSKNGESFNCNCGFIKPNADWNLVGNNLIAKNDNSKNFEVESLIPGKAALQNAARALIVAKEFGLEVDTASEAISKIKSVDGRFAVKQIGQTNFRLRPQLNPASWRENESPENGGGLLLDLQTHLISTALDWFGPAQLVHAQIRNIRGESEDDVLLALKHETGVDSYLSASAIAGNPGPRIRLLGSEGALVIEDLDPQEALLRSGEFPEGGLWKVPTSSRAYIYRGDVKEEVAAQPGNYGKFYLALKDALSQGSALPISEEQVLAVAKVIDKAREINAR